MNNAGTVTSWHAYPKLYNLGHAALGELLLDPVYVEEKVDGSQFSFGIFDGELKCRSKGKQIVMDAPDALFIKAVEVVRQIADKLTDGYTYRAEYLQKPKHNAHAYDRTPINHLMVFDVNTGEEQYMSYEDKAKEAARIGLEVVPLVFFGEISSADQIMEMMDRVSILGGQKIEGLVIKNYNRFGPDKKAIMGKHVSEAFKEVHRRDFKKQSPSQADIVKSLHETYKSKARWRKAVQHIAERGELTGTPKDIGPLIKEVQTDILAECEDEIKQALFDWAKARLMRGVIHGFPEWYKEELVKNQFEDQDASEASQDLAPGTCEAEQPPL